MIDLRPYHDVIQKLNSGNYTLDGRMNLACWLGERTYKLVTEIERLYAEQATATDGDTMGGYCSDCGCMDYHSSVCPRYSRV